MYALTIIASSLNEANRRQVEALVPSLGAFVLPPKRRPAESGQARCSCALFAALAPTEALRSA
jgi:hypothetical protein